LYFPDGFLAYPSEVRPRSDHVKILPTMSARWERVARLYESALDQPPDSRHAFVASAADDDDVRREVESLLAQEAYAGPLDSSVWETAAGLLDDGQDLPAGCWLGPYRIESVLGVGGMGEVYRATDTRLDRVVAVKVLPRAYSRDHTFRERFEREAKAVAALGHPHICALYDVGRARVRLDDPFDGAEGTRDESIDYLVLEYVDGETLASRLTRGPLAPAQALRFAIEIGDALAMAHRRGLVHRDLKPGNIMLTKSGAKLLDFGLAKTVAPPLAATPDSAAGAPPREVTVNGAIVGTFQYMAPEQLEGRHTDTRTDIFAFGAVAYEMFTGRKAFEGQSQAALIGAILKEEPPPISRSQPLAPAVLDHVIRRCLAKDPDERWQTSADLTRELRYIAERPQRRTRWRMQPAAALLALCALGVGAAGTWWSLRARPAAERSYQLSVTLPEGLNAIPIGPTSRFAIAPDGQRLAFVASRPDGIVRLFVRTLDHIETRELPGTDGAILPFWSPDSGSIGFIADGTLKRVTLDGSVLTLARQAAPAPAAWSRDGVILFTPTRTSGLHRISASGGEPTPITTIDTGADEIAHVAPFFLADGHHFFYLALNGTASGRSVAASTYIADLDSRDPRKLILKAGSNVAYASGHLLFVRESTLMAQPFDDARLEPTGEAVPIAEHVTRGGYFAFGQGSAFSTSDEGTLAFQAGEPFVELTWFDRTGRKVGVVGNPLRPDAFADVAVSRDGSQAIVTTLDPQTQAFSLWRYDTARRSTTRLTFGSVDDVSPFLSPDDARVFFGSRRMGHLDLFERSIVGGGDDAVRLADERDKYPMGWSGDGRLLLFVVNPPGEVWALPRESDRPAFPVLRGPSGVQTAQLSPDGRWLAYASTESGRSEIYVTEFPTPRTKRPISTNGGDHPRWRGDGHEIFFRSTGMLMVADVTGGPGRIEFGMPRPLFDVRQAIGSGGPSRYFYDVTPDGQRFLVGSRVLVGEENIDRGEVAGSIAVLVNWPARLTRQAAR
jgi:serine/threonine protein kinase/Tol biopolymer transport system component